MSLKDHGVEEVRPEMGENWTMGVALESRKDTTTARTNLQARREQRRNT